MQRLKLTRNIKISEMVYYKILIRDASVLKFYQL